jgi:hypothetical protein
MENSNDGSNQIEVVIIIIMKIEIELEPNEHANEIFSIADASIRKQI